MRPVLVLLFALLACVQHPDAAPYTEERGLGCADEHGAGVCAVLRNEVGWSVAHDFAAAGNTSALEAALTVRAPEAGTALVGLGAGDGGSQPAGRAAATPAAAAASVRPRSVRRTKAARLRARACPPTSAVHPLGGLQRRPD